MSPPSGRPPRVPAAPGRRAAGAGGHVPAAATPRSRPCAHPWLPSLYLTALVALSVAASVAGSRILLVVDEPVQRWVEGHRTAVLDDVFRTVTSLGAGVPVVVAGTALALVAWRRSPGVGLAVLAVTLARPVVVTVLKAVIGRQRPDLDPLVPRTGPSFPSGHVVAAMVLWGAVPWVTSLHTRRRELWWAAVALATVVVGAVAASRVYLGVHWLSDVVGGVMVGAALLAAGRAVARAGLPARGSGPGSGPRPGPRPRPGSARDQHRGDRQVVGDRGQAPEAVVADPGNADVDDLQP